ncbi:MAG: hypothetical protein Q8R08_00220 [bacterium]|nr:hypothetical protein [bacterium]
MSEEKEISWSAPEFVHYPKSTGWFVAVGIVGLILIIYFLFQRDFLTASLFILLTVILVYFAKLPAKTLHIHLTTTGVKINESRLSYQQIKSFWMVYNPPEVKTLNFETGAYLNRFITLQLENEDPVKIRRFLAEYLTEDLEKGELFSDKVSRNLKF